MADLQIVFADNPTAEGDWKPSAEGAKVKSRLQSQAKTSKVKRKENSRMRTPAQLRNDRRLGRLAKARARAKKKKKNPYYFKATKKGKKAKKTGRFPSKKELKSWTKRTYAIDERTARKPGRKAKKKYKRAFSKAKRIGGKLKTQLKRGPAARRRAVSAAAKLRKQGYKVKKVYVSEKALLRKRRKKKSKAKKRTSRKGAKVAKKKKSRGKKRAKKSRGKKGRGRKRGSRKGKRRSIYLRPSRKSVTIRWKKNPDLASMAKTYTGLDMSHLGGLLAGGALYGATDRALARYLPGVYQSLFSIPVIGNALPTLIAGIAGKMIFSKYVKVSALETVSEGLIGAAIVAAGAQAGSGIVSQIPGLSGVDFTRGPGVMNGYARDGADFGAVDYTPGMGSAPQLGMQAQMGRDPGNPDFGEIPEGLSGFAEIPQGLN